MDMWKERDQKDKGAEIELNIEAKGEDSLRK